MFNPKCRHHNLLRWQTFRTQVTECNAIRDESSSFVIPCVSDKSPQMHGCSFVTVRSHSLSLLYTRARIGRKNDKQWEHLHLFKIKCVVI